MVWHLYMICKGDSQRQKTAMDLFSKDPGITEVLSILLYEERFLCCRIYVITKHGHNNNPRASSPSYSISLTSESIHALNTDFSLLEGASPGFPQVTI